MNTADHNAHEHDLQRLAEQAERGQTSAASNAQVDQYRLVYRALGRAPALTVPDNFAQSVLARIARAEDKSGVDDAVISTLMLAMAITGLVFVYPYLSALINQLHALLPAIDGLASPLTRLAHGLPWPMLLGAAAAIAAALSLDTLVVKKPADQG